MASKTRRALEDFDNPHDFERMAADVLNALGYAAVEPMAVAGGSDAGTDIRFRERETSGIALVTLEKRIRDKFKRDLAKQEDREGVLALFSNVDVSPSMKLEFTKEALAKGYRLEVFDLERLRSLLDSGLKDVRRRYLGIDDAISAKLRSDVTKLLRFPSATPDRNPGGATLLETLLVNQVPRRLFELLMEKDEEDVLEVPQIGSTLRQHLLDYYSFRQRALALEENLLHRIAQLADVRFVEGWRIYLRYALMRFGGASQDQIIGWGDFLNYDITWEKAEEMFKQVSESRQLSQEVSDLFLLNKQLQERIAGVKQIA